MTKNELKKFITKPDYPFPDNSIEHHYYINHPTNYLEFKIEFEDGNIVDNFNALAFVGRSFSRQSLDHKEVNRIKDSITVQEFLKSKVVTMCVNKPLFGFNYAISWTLK